MPYTFTLPSVLCVFLTFTFAHLTLGNAIQSRALQSSKVPITSCATDFTMTPKLWMDLKMNEYMMGYPNIDKITLAQFAREVGTANFFCGVHQNCNAGQNCQSATDRNWIILLAVQKWNEQLNNLYASINTASDIVKAACAKIIKDFLPDTKQDSSMFGWAIATLVIGILGAIIAPLVPMFAPEAITHAVAAYRSEASLGQAAANYAAARAAAEAHDAVALAHIAEANDVRIIQSAISDAHHSAAELPLLTKTSAPPVKFASSSGASHEAFVPPHDASHEAFVPLSSSPPGKLASPNKAPPGEFVPPKNLHHKRSHLPTSNVLSRRTTLQKRGRPPPSAYAFDQFANLDAHVAGLQQRLLNVVDVISELGTTEAIWSDNGLAATLYNGAMFVGLPSLIQNQENHVKFAKLTVLSEFFLSQNYFITMNSDPCTSKGVNGAWPSDRFLSYCTPQGSMRNIIKAEGKKVRNEFDQASILIRDYFSVSFLTDIAIKCQEKYGLYKEQKFPAPQNWTSPCTFTLPVCDMSLDVVRKKLKKKHRTVLACRLGANLPI